MRKLLLTLGGMVALLLPPSVAGAAPPMTCVELTPLETHFFSTAKVVSAGYYVGFSERVGICVHDSTEVGAPGDVSYYVEWSPDGGANWFHSGGVTDVIDGAGGTDGTQNVTNTLAPGEVFFTVPVLAPFVRVAAQPTATASGSVYHTGTKVFLCFRASP